MNFRKQEESTLEGKGRANDIIYIFIASVTGFPDKFYLRTAQ